MILPTPRNSPQPLPNTLDGKVKLHGHDCEIHLTHVPGKWPKDILTIGNDDYEAIKNPTAYPGCILGRRPEGTVLIDLNADKVEKANQNPGAWAREYALKNAGEITSLPNANAIILESEVASDSLSGNLAHIAWA